MTRNHAYRALLFMFVALTAAAGFSQSQSWQRAGDISNGVRGTIVGTVTDIDSARGRISLSSDSDPSGAMIMVSSDSLATDYYGFGAADDRRAISGSSGFSQVRVGDRLQVRGIGAPGAMIAAGDITLLGRSVTPPVASITDNTGSVEGVVRQIDAGQYRLTIETDRRELFTVYGSSSTPVNFHSDTYRIPNIEIGDRIRVAVDSSTSSGIRARQIEVISSVTDTAGTSKTTLTSIVGSVTAIDARTETFRLARAGGAEVKVDARFATDTRGNTYRLSSLKVGDIVEVTGQFLSASSFRADGIRPGVDEYPDRGGRQRLPGDNTGIIPRTRPIEDTSGIATVVIYGTVTEGLKSNETLRVKDSSNNQVVDVSVLDDFPVRLTTGSYSTADRLKVGDKVVVQTYRCGGRYFAQTIRTR